MITSGKTPELADYLPAPIREGLKNNWVCEILANLGSGEKKQ